MKMILVAVMMIFWVSMMNKLYYGCQFWYVTILFYSNKLLKLKYIHHYFFLKFLTEKSRWVLWAGKYGNYVVYPQLNKCNSSLYFNCIHEIWKVLQQEHIYLRLVLNYALRVANFYWSMFI